MATVVIVHGAWGGGWEWTHVARILRERHHDVFTPTLTGTGERAHLGGRGVTLATHVQDVVAVLEAEDLHDVVLCAHSSAGVAVTGAADRVPDRIEVLAYVDALVPRDGQSLLDLLPAWFGEEVRHVEAQDGAWRVPMPARLLPPQGWIPDEELRHYLRRLRDQPVGTFTEPLRLTGAVDGLRRAFVRCTRTDYAARAGEDPVAAGARRARAEHWTYRELPAPHDCQLLDPAGTAAVLHELASVVSGELGFSSANA
jgi:pimeloyl-ACP methyl ester carboxylesterase